MVAYRQLEIEENFGSILGGCTILCRIRTRLDFFSGYCGGKSASFVQAENGRNERFGLSQSNLRLQMVLLLSFFWASLMSGEHGPRAAGGRTSSTRREADAGGKDGPCEKPGPPGFLFRLFT